MLALENEQLQKLEELRELESKIREETIESVLKTIEINDSYFYAKMVIMEAPLMDDPFQQKVKAIITINLCNSKEFQNENIVNDKRVIKPKVIKSTITFDKNLVNQKEDLMMLIYEEVSKEIAKDLFQENARNIHMSFQDRNTSNRKYI